MSLPHMVVPVDTIKLYSQPKPIKIRPYLVGEEKLLLMAQQAREQDPKSPEVEKAVRQIIERCSFGAIEMNTLPVFDVSMLFLKLRSMSLSNVIETQFRCKNILNTTVDGNVGPPRVCETLVPVKIDIADIQLTIPPGHTNKVMLDEHLGITLKYPTVPVYDQVQPDVAETIAACLLTVFRTADDATADVWEVAGESPKDVESFVNELSLTHVAKIRAAFFDTMPRLTHTFTFQCPKCGYTEDIVLQELEDFFE
jgi:hypothetical protein